MRNYPAYLKRLLLACCCVFCFGLVINVQAAPKAKKTHYLFVLSSKFGQIEKSSQSGTLTLTSIDSHVLWFSDRPIRKAGFVSTKGFVASWANAFKGNAPSATLVQADMAYTKGRHQEPLMLELKNPKMQQGRLTFQIKGLRGPLVNGSAIMLHNVKLLINAEKALNITAPRCRAGIINGKCYQ